MDNQIVTLNGKVHDLGGKSVVRHGNPLWRPGYPLTINGKMQQGVSINGFSYPPAPSNCVLYLPGLPGYGSTIWDRSNGGNNGTITGATWVRLSSGLWGLIYDATDDVVILGANASLDNLAALTLIAWLTPTSQGENNRGIIFNKASSIGGPGWEIRFATLSDLIFIADFATSDLSQATSASAVATDGTPQLLIVTWDGSATAANVHIYINNVDKVASPVNGVGARSDDSGAVLRIGNEVGGTRTWGGGIYLPRIFNTVITASERSAIYNKERHLFGV